MAYLGVSPSNGVRQKHTYTATASQTSFSGVGDENITLSYRDSNYVDVYQNGVKLSEADYTATSGTAIVLATGATVSDMIEIVVYDVFSVADTVSKADGGQFDGNVTMAGTLGVTGNQTNSGTLAVTGAITSSAGMTITTADNTDQLTLKSTDADASVGPVLNLQRDSSSPADDDAMGTIDFRGENSASEVINYVRFNGRSADVTDGTEDGKFDINTYQAGASVNRLSLTPTETVFNEDSVDVDFRVEGNGDANLLFCDGGSDFVAIGESSQINSGKLNIATSASDAVLSMLCRSTTDSHHNKIVMQKSSTASGNFAATADGEFLGSIIFRGVNGSAVSDIGAQITAKQNGTSSSTVQTDLIFNTTESTRMTLSSDGFLFFGCTNTPSSSLAGFALSPNIVSIAPHRSSAGNNNGAMTHITFINGNGTVGSITTSGTSTGFNTSSDYRLKESITYDFDATTRLKQLKPCRFNFIADADTTVDGFLAHEVSSVVPEAINGTKDGTRDVGTLKDEDSNVLYENVPESAKEDGQTWTKTATENVYQGIDQSKLVPLLVKSLQEALTEIDTLKTKVAALENA